MEAPNGVFSRTITAKQLMDLCHLIRETKLGIRLQSINWVKSVISIAITSGKYNAQTTHIIPRVAKHSSRSIPEGYGGSSIPVGYGAQRRGQHTSRSIPGGYEGGCGSGGLSLSIFEENGEGGLQGREGSSACPGSIGGAGVGRLPQRIAAPVIYPEYFAK